MSEPGDENATSPLKKLLSGTDTATRAVQAVLGLSGVLVLLKNEWRKEPFVLGAALLLICLGALWFIVGIFLRKRRPTDEKLPATPRGESAYLRGLLPFEKGDRLLGRDQDKGQLLAMLRSLEYKFGFLSGEAGSGKTSLLRALIAPQLEAEERIVLYVARTGGDPETAIVRELLNHPRFPANAQKQGGLVDLLKTVFLEGKVRAIVIIVDQFEEFFILNRTKERRLAFQSILEDIAQTDIKVSFVFSLRKEFVDDLLDIGTAIPQLKNARWRYPLRNLSSATAREVLRKIVTEEGLRFSEQLQDTLILDLTRDQKVRPVEFQLVLTTLHTQDIFDMAGYAAAQGAHGVLANFIKEIISPPDSKTTPVEVRTAQQVLRALCDDEFRSRRPVGLTSEELLQRIVIDAKGTSQVPASKKELKFALDNILARSLDNFVVIRESEDRYNLAHDYLVTPVRNATVGLETTEEQANKLLDRYIENARVDRVILPWKSRRFIQRFATPELLGRSEAKKLIRRSQLQQIAIGSSGVAVILVVLALSLPFGVKYTVSEKIRLDGKIIVSNDGTVMVSANKAGLTIYDLTRSELKPRSVKFGSTITNTVLSSHGDSALLLLDDGSLYQLNVRDAGTPKKIAQSTWRGLRSFQPPMGFSKNGNWIYFINENGGVYAWPRNNEPSEIFKLRFLKDAFSSPIAVSDEKPDKSSKKEKAVLPPEAGISDHGHFWVVDGAGKFFALNVAERSIGNPIELLGIQLDVMHPRNVSALPNGNGLLIADLSQEIRVVNFPASASRYSIAKISLDRDNRDQSFNQTPNAAVSPSMKWLVYRRTFQSFYAVDLTAKNPTAGFPAIALPSSGSDSDAKVLFDQTETFAMGKAQDQKFYLWKLESPPGTSAKPLVESINKPHANAVFCPNGRDVVVALEDGSLHSIDFRTPGAKPRALGWLAAGRPSFFRLKDNVTILVHDGSRLAETHCDNDMKVIHDQQSSIVDVVDDGSGNLIVIGENEIGRIAKAFYMFGIRVWRIPIAGMDRTSIVRDVGRDLF
ncbi:MAG: AAA family ATPase [Massilia sp.]